MATGPVGEASVTQSGDVGGNGISRFYFQKVGGGSITAVEATAYLGHLNNFYLAINDRLPVGMLYQTQQEVRLQDAETGALLGFVLGSTSYVPVGGTVAAFGYPGGTGARIQWVTSSVVGRRLLRGATFIVPLAAATYSTTGFINSAVSAHLQSASFAMVTACLADGLQPVVYHRPAKGATSGGFAGAITATLCGQTPASLRSRRL